MIPFSDWWGMVRLLKAVQRQNDDAVVVIDGPEGAGKSTLAFKLCLAIEEAWDPESRVIIDYEDWLDYYETHQRGVTYLLDEGGNLAFSRDSMSGQNKHVVKILQMARILNNVMVVCCPNVMWLDKYLREHRTLIYIRVKKEYHPDGVERGRATAHWKIKRFNPAMNREDGGIWTPAFDVHFKPIPDEDERWRAYEQLKIAKIHSSALAMAQKAVK